MIAAGRSRDSLVYSYVYGPEAGNTTCEWRRRALSC
jgi:hypothetical protein